MLERTPRNLLTKSNIFLAFFLAMGLAIFVLMVDFGDRIEQSNAKFSQQELTLRDQIHTLGNLLTRQQLYFYTNTPPFTVERSQHTTMQQELANVQQQIAESIDLIRLNFADDKALKTIGNIKNYQLQFIQLAQQLEFAAFPNVIPQSEQASFSKQMQQLTQQSEVAVQQLLDLSNVRIQQSAQKVSRIIAQAKLIILSFGVLAATTFFLLLRYIKSITTFSQLNSRLAQYPQRTLNPIISLDKQNHVNYCNSATNKLLERFKHLYTGVSELLPENLVETQSELIANDKQFARFEYSIGNALFECDLHWLPDHQQWDMHLTDVTAKRQAELKMQYQAYHHPETGLENQYRFSEIVELWVSTKKTFTLGQLEIRSFSQILADHSFDKSQQVVIELASVLEKVAQDMNEGVRFFHIGNKNFAALIPSSNCEKTVIDLVQNIKQSIKATQFTDQHSLDLDFGFACFPKDGSDVEEIVRNARIALDTSASQEHTDYIIFSNSLGETIARQNSLQAAMREAIDKQQFQLYFQPQLALQENVIVGAEILLRWQLNGQWISPSEFIPLAERSGLILPIGTWVLNTACQKAKQLVNMGHKQFVIAVNISPKQFAAPNFVEQVRLALHESALSAHNLELEITEGVLFNNDPATIASLFRLKKMGVKLGIDDFGTGYSSLSYLKDFPIDKIKIDQSFVRNMHNDNADQSIVRSVVDLGKNLGITLIAEGVEQQVQIDMLKKMGCHEIQGDWFSKPLDEGFFTFFLQQNSSIAEVGD